MNRIFLLSPANCGGVRAAMVMREEAQFPLARQLKSEEGAPLGELFTFMSGLYFRGKVTYARHFADPPAGLPGVLVITPGRGLLPADQLLTRSELLELSRVDINLKEARYTGPLQRDAASVAAAAGDGCEVVLLGSVATGKYVDVLTKVFGNKLVFPEDFVGRGDMSRGGLLLRCVEEQRQLPYVPVIGAVLHGPRPPRLPRKERPPDTVP